MTTRRLDNKTPAQRAWATAHNTNAHYRERGPETDRVRTARILENQLDWTLRAWLDDRHGNYDRLGLADMHMDIVQRLEALRAAVVAAGEDPE